MSALFPDHSSIIHSWVRKEAAFDQSLRAIIPGLGFSLMALAVVLGFDEPRDDVSGTVFFQYRGWVDEPYFEVGVQLRPPDEEQPVNVVFGTMETIEDGVICPVEGVPPVCAGMLGAMAMSKQHWAELRGARLNEDATLLLLEPVPV